MKNQEQMRAYWRLQNTVKEIKKLVNKQYLTDKEETKLNKLYIKLENDQDELNYQRGI